MDLSAFNLQGKVALITGGAHGIGFSIAEGMAKCGAVICFNCSSEASLKRAWPPTRLPASTPTAMWQTFPDEDAVNAMVAKIKAEVGPVDILVNNAGLMKRVPMIEMSHADFMRVIDVHVGGAFNCSKAVLPDMMEKREGKIINICSMMSELGRETVSAYAAAKGALKMLTKNIASEYGEYNIQCNGMGPGYIATAQTAPLRELQPDGSRHPFDQLHRRQDPRRPLG
ncbi:MAG: SDR family NAD(P)-dependent oxidoreductase [Faecalibacterium prausnitzii]